MAAVTEATPNIWGQLAEPFPDEAISSYSGRGGLIFRYISARDVMQRLDEVLTPLRWSFEWDLVDPARHVVKGRLRIMSDDGIMLIREDVGYPNNSQDEEPLKGAVSDALKRCAVHYGIGRHLYAEKPKADDSRPQAPPRARLAVVPPNEQTLVCACGTDRVFKQGTNAKGKDWEGWFCASNPGKCEPIWGGFDLFHAPVDDGDSVPF